MEWLLGEQTMRSDPHILQVFFFFLCFFLLPFVMADFMSDYQANKSLEFLSGLRNNNSG